MSQYCVIAKNACFILMRYVCFILHAICLFHLMRYVCFMLYVIRLFHFDAIRMLYTLCNMLDTMRMLYALCNTPVLYFMRYAYFILYAIRLFYALREKSILCEGLGSRIYIEGSASIKSLLSQLFTG